MQLSLRLWVLGLLVAVSYALDCSVVSQISAPDCVSAGPVREYRVELHAGQAANSFNWEIRTINDADVSESPFQLSKTNIDTPAGQNTFVTFNRAFDKNQDLCADFTIGVRLTMVQGDTTLTCDVDVANTDGSAPILRFKVSEDDPSAGVLSSNLNGYVRYEIQDVPEAEYGVAEDHCYGETSVIFTEDVSGELKSQEFGSQGVHALIRRWTSSDACGNQAEFVQTIDVYDITPPVVTGPPDTTVDCGSDITACAVETSDNSGIEPWIQVAEGEYSEGAEDCNFNYKLVRTWKATDHVGNIGSYKQTIQVIDNEPPQVTGVPIEDVTIPCDTDVTPVMPIAKDNCDKFPVCDNSIEYIGETRVLKWCCTDKCGNQRCRRHQQTLVDDKPPNLPQLPDVTESCTAEGFSSFQRGQDCEETMVWDNCDAEPRWDLHNERVDGDCKFNYKYVQTYAAVDRSGNWNSTVRVINVYDDISPTFDGADPEDFTEDCALPAAVVRNASHPCQGAVPVVQNDVKLDDDIYNFRTERTWRATTLCGKTVSHTMTVTVVDVTAPEIINVPADITVDCHEVPTASAATVTVLPDNCCEHTLVYTETRTNGTCDNEYTLLRAWTATDCAGNAHTQTQTIVVNYVLPVMTSSPANQTLEWYFGITHPVVDPTYTYTCPGPAFAYTQTIEDGDCDHRYVITRHWSVNDGCEDVPHTQVITVQDTTPPVLVGVADQFATCSQTDEQADLWGVTAHDPNYSGDVAGVLTPTLACAASVDGRCPHAGHRDCTYSVTDACGLTTTADVTETWDDVAIPFIDAATKAGTDNCRTPQPVTYADHSDPDDLGRCNVERIYVETWSAVDLCTNDAVDVVEKTTIWDVTPPVLAGVPDDITLLCQITPYPTAPEVTATDNNDVSGTFPGVVTPTNITESVHGCGRTIIRTWQIQDCGSNHVLDTQTITVNEPVEAGVSAYWENAAPVDYTMECPDVPTFPVMTAKTACGESFDIPGSTVESVGTPATQKIYTHTWTWTDGCQSLSAVTVATVSDTTAPTITGHVDTSNACAHVVSTPVFADRCDANIADQCVPTDTQVNTTQSKQYEVTRVWTCTDDTGFVTTASAVHQAYDTTPPTFETTPGPETVECSHTPYTLHYSDNCDATSREATDRVTTDTVVDHTGTVTSVWTIVDAAGNVNSHTQVVTVHDVNPPTWTFTVSPVTIDCFEDLVPPVPGSATDDCDSDVDVQVATVHTQPDCDNQGHSVHTWTATDDSGLQSYKTQTVYYNDINPPVVNNVFPTVTVEWFTDVPSMFSASHITDVTDDCDSFADFTVTCNYTNNGPGATCHRTHEWDCTVVDKCGNTQFYDKMFVVVEEDTRVPVITPKPANVFLQCAEYPNHPVLPSNATTTNVEADTQVTDLWSDAGNSYSCKTMTRTFSLEWCGRSDSHVQTIQVVDFDSPKISNIPAYNDAECLPPTKGNPDVVDHCQGEMQASLTITDETSPIDRGYMYRRTVMANDDCGNMVTHMYNFTVADVTDPWFTDALPADVTIEGPAVPETMAVRAADDNCNAHTVVTDEQSTNDGCPSNYTVVRTWTVTDTVGNSITELQTVIARDSKKPRWSVAVPTDTTITYEKHIADNSATLDPFDLTATDDAGPVTVVFNEVETRDPTAMNNFVLTRNWMATDECGHSIAHTQKITVTSPEPCEPPNEVYECDVDAADVTPGSFFVDNCTAHMVHVQVSVVEVTEQGSCPDAWFVHRTFTIADNEGINSIDIDQTITFQDTVAPVFDAPDTTRTMNLTKTQCGQPDAPIKTATDNCDEDVTITMDHTTGVTGTLDTSLLHVYTYTACDDCGNCDTTTHTDTLIDDRQLEWVAEPTDDSEQCGEPVLPTVTCDPVCGKTCTTIKEESDIVLTESCPRTIVRRWNAIDSMGFTAQTSQTVTVDDTVPPVVTALPDCENECYETCIHGASAADNCDGVVATSEVCTGDKYSGSCTYTATDACGNGHSATQVFTHAAELPPIITVAPSDYSNECNDLETIPRVEATDDCEASIDLVVNYTEADISPATCHDTNVVSRVVRNWLVTDKHGLTTPHSHTVTVTDSSDPIFINAPANGSTKTVQCTEPVYNVTAHDGCDVGGATVLSPTRTDLVHPSGGVAKLYTLAWTYTDTCGKVIDTLVTVDVEDTAPPELQYTHQASVSVACGEDFPDVPTVTQSDNCDTGTLDFTETSASDACNGGEVRTRVWTVTDAQGNVDSITQVVSKVAQKAPVCSLVNATQTVECPALLQDPVVSCTDPCSGATLEYATSKDMTSGAGGLTLAGTWTMTATEPTCGLTHAVVETRAREDNAPPVFDAVPDDTTQDCLPQYPANPTCSDDCDDSPLVEAADLPVSVDGCSDTYRRVYTCTDANGLSATHTYSSKAEDNEAPQFSGIPDSYTFECPFTYSAPTVTANDNCDGDILVTHNAVQILARADSDPITVVHREVYTFTAVDTCGQSSTEGYTITVEDTTAPTLSGDFSTVVLECTQLPDLSVSYTDACSAVNLVHTNVTTSACGLTGATVYSWTATDAHGNVASANRTVIVVDLKAPTLIFTGGDGIEDRTLEIGSTYNPPQCTGQDKCSAAPCVVHDPVAVSTTENVEYVTAYMWSAEDECGNIRVSHSTITFTDTVSPYLPTPPVDETMECTRMSDAIADPAVMDAVDPSPSISVQDTTDKAAHCNGEATRTLVYTFTDVSGNTDNHTRTVFYEDTTGPTLDVVGSSLTVACHDFDSTPVPTATATDNCGDGHVNTTATVDDPEGCAGSYTKTWVFTSADDCGNTGESETVTWTIFDDLAPVFSPATLEPETIVAGAAFPSLPNVDAADACSANVTITFDYATTSDGCTTVHTRSWDVVDDCGNQKRIEQVITEEESSLPVLTGLTASHNVECGNNDWAAQLPKVTAVDRVGHHLDVEVIIAVDHQDPVCTCDATYNVTYTAEDACGNKAVAVTIVSIVDTSAPVFTCDAPDVTVACAAEVPAAVNLTARDNAWPTPRVIDMVETSAGSDCDGQIVRTWTASDCSNIQVVSQTVTVLDDKPPRLARLPSEITVECGCDTIPAEADVEALDACDSDITVSVSETKTAVDWSFGNDFGNVIQHVYRTYQAVDDCGNEVKHVHTIVIQDNTPPALSCTPEDKEVSCELSLDETDDQAVYATDECDDTVAATVLTTDVIPGDRCSNEETIIRSWYAQDRAGNEVSHSQTITVSDNVSPVPISSESAVNCLYANDNTYVASVADMFSAFDNCDETGASVVVNMLSCNSTQLDGNTGYSASSGMFSHAECKESDDGLSIELAASTTGDYDRDYYIYAELEDACGNKASHGFNIRVYYDMATAAQEGCTVP